MNPYVIGLVASDGHINAYKWLISQSHKGVDALRKIQILYPGGKLIPSKGGENRYSEELSYGLFYDIGDNSKLFKEWGVPRGKKSYLLTFPENKSRDDIWLYLRGYFEGDGSVHLDGKYPRVQIIANRVWCEKCSDFLKENKILSYIFDDKRHKGISNLIIRRVNSVHNFFDKIYEDDIPLFMNRKYYKWLEIKSVCISNVEERKIKKLLSDSEKEIIIVKLKEGKRPFEISKELNISERVIGRIYRDYFGGRKVAINKIEEEIKYLLKSGKSNQYLYEKGYSKKVVNRVINRNRAKIPRRKGDKITDELSNKIKKDLISGVSPKDISLQFNVSFARVCEIDRLLTGGRKNRIDKKAFEAKKWIEKGYSARYLNKKLKFTYTAIKKAKELI